MTSCCEHGDEPSGFVKGGGFLEQLSGLSASQERVFPGVGYVSLIYPSTLRHPFFLPIHYFEPWAEHIKNTVHCTPFVGK
jgi:hypothetical protein